MPANKPVSTYLLVDGNNIIHAWPGLLELHRKRRGLAHAELCRQLKPVHDFGGMRVVVVFDGRGASVSEEREPGGFQVITTDNRRTADDVIERLASSYSKKHRILVATDDRAEQNMVASMGAEVMSSRGLRDLVDRNESKWRDYL